MQNLIETQASQLARAANDIAAVAAVGYLHGVLLHLFVDPVAITPTTPLATFTAAEANYTGYASVALAWDVPGVSQDGNVEVVATAIVFRPSDGVTPNVVWGVYLTDSGDTQWYFAGPIDNAPVPLQNALQQLQVTISYRPATNSIVITFS